MTTTLTHHPSRLTLRVTRRSLSFSAPSPQNRYTVDFEPYTVRSGMSMAANLREAMREARLTQEGFERVQVMADGPVLIIPADEVGDNDAEQLFRHTFTADEPLTVKTAMMPQLGVMAAFGVNSDLCTVVGDNYADVRFIPLMLPVWSHLHLRSFTGQRRKLYGYFHDKRLDICSFDKNRLRFANSYDVSAAKDAAYFLLYVWQQLAFDARRDELHLLGTPPDADDLTTYLRRYVAQVLVLNPSAEFNRAPITQLPGMPFDLMALYMRK